MAGIPTRETTTIRLTSPGFSGVTIRPSGPAAQRPSGPAAQRPSGMTCARRGAGAQQSAASTSSRTPSSGPRPPEDRSRPDAPGGRARLSLLLPVLALLLGALGLFAAAPAQAQSTTTIWSATLTVGTASDRYGCAQTAYGSVGVCTSTRLNPNSFTHSGTSYTVNNLFYEDDDLHFGVTGTGTGSAFKTALSGLTLTLTKSGTASSFAISDTRTSLTTRLLFWSNASLNWSSGDTVTVKLTQAATTTKPAKPTNLSATAGNAQVALSWDDPSDSSITKYQYQQKAGTNDWGSWTNIPNSAPGGTNATSYTVTSLTNGTTYQFRIRAVNTAGSSPQSNTAGPVTPAAPAGPRVTGALAITSSAATYNEDDNIKVTVTFDKAIVVVGTPELTIKVGTDDKTATCAAHATQNTKLVCTYTVAIGDEDTDGVSVEANKLSLPTSPTTTIKDSNGNDATLTHNALAAQSGHKVDAKEPAITGLAMASTPAAAGAYAASEVVKVEVSFHEAITVIIGSGESITLALKVGTADKSATCVKKGTTGEDAKKLVCSYTVLADDEDRDGVSVDAGSLTAGDNTYIEDAQENESDLTHPALAAQSGHKVDAVKPSISFPDGVTPTVGTAATITLTDAGAKIKKYKVLEVPGATMAATACDDPSGDSFTPTSLTTAASPKTVSHTPSAGSTGKKLCVYAEDAAGNSNSKLWTTAIAAAPVVTGPTPQTVAADWACIPKDSSNNALVTAGQSFRLLFVTSTKTQATSTSISTYNDIVKTRAATSSCFTTAQANQFRAFISTSATSAKSNTATTGTGEPIYWMKGAKVADNYADFFDNTWDSNAAKNESGTSQSGFAWTGTWSNGNSRSGRTAGSDNVSWVNPSSSGNLGAGNSPKGNSQRLLAFSPVLTVQATATKPAKPTNLSATAGNAQVALSWDDPSDSSITKYQYQQKAGTAAWGSWTNIPNSAPGGANATSYTVTSLTNGTVYRFRIRAVNPAGNGPQSEVAGPATPAAAITPLPTPRAGSVWQARLTVDRLSSTAAGCDDGNVNQANCSSALTDNNFTYAGATYEIDEIDLDADNDTLDIYFDKTVPLIARETLTLYVGSSSLGFLEDGLWDSSYTNVQFDTTAAWTDNQKVILELTGDTTPPTVSSAGYFNSAAATNAISGVVSSAFDIYTKVTFSENMNHVKSDVAAARPEISYRIGSTDTQYDILNNADMLASGDCKPNHATNTNVYVCRYTVGASDNGAFTVKVGTNSVDKVNNALQTAYIHSTTLTLDTTNPAIEFPSGVTPRVGTASTITLTDAGAKIKKYGAIVVDGTTGSAADCDAGSSGLENKLTTLSSPQASVNFAYTIPANSVGKKVCAFAEDAAGNSNSLLWDTVIAAASVTVTTETKWIPGRPTGPVTLTATDGTSLTLDLETAWRMRGKRVDFKGAELTDAQKTLPAGFWPGGTVTEIDPEVDLQMGENPTVCMPVSSSGETQVLRWDAGRGAWSELRMTSRSASQVCATTAGLGLFVAAAGTVTIEDRVTRHGYKLSHFRAAPEAIRINVSWSVLNPGRRCRFVVAWRRVADSEETVPWRHEDVFSYHGSVSHGIRGLTEGTSYDVRLFVPAPGSTGDPADADLAYEVTVTTKGQSMATPPITAAVPALEWARVNAAELALRFDAALDESSVPAGGAFAVSVADASRAVSAVSVSQETVTLTLASAVTSDEVVTVGYTPPATGKLRASGGGAEVAAFTGQTVTNDTPVSGLLQQAPPPVPLTASVASAPGEHKGKGKGKFTVKVAFSAPVAGRVRAAARTIQVTGGTLKRVRRAGGADRWALDIQPSSNAAVTLTLPATTDCAVRGAICTADGRKLGTALTHTVPGPASLSVADASAQEGPGATIDFPVTLSRAASGEVTVRYATRDGTAKKRRDYRKTSGTLTFAAGETAKTVSVVILDDAHDEGTETFTLKLSKPKGAAITDGEATGTITNADPLQRDWLARFGRAAAADAVAAVTARLETPRDAGSHVTLGGHRLALGGSGGKSSRPPEPAGRPGGAPWLSWSGEPAGEYSSRAMSGRELLMGTSFRAVLGNGAGPQWTGWGQGASVSAFSSAGPGLSLSGETATGSMGMDYEWGRLLTGFAMTHSLGEGTAEGAGRSYVMGSTVTTMLPYLRVALSERVSAWGLAGTGTGRLTLDLAGGAPERYGADLTMSLAAMGIRGDLVTPAEAGGFALALKADAFWVRTESDAVSVPGAGNLAAGRGEASRLRAVLDGSRSFALAGGATLTPSVAFGVRHDGGDAETGTGLEFGAGLGYAAPSRGLDMALRVHGLASHAEEGYGEWGVSGSLRLVPGAAGRGLSMSLTPSYGADPGGSDRLWMLPDVSGLAANGGADRSGRLDAEVGYGLALFGGGFTGTPHVGLGLSETDREVRMGWRLSPADDGDFSFRMDASRRDSAGDGPEHRIGFGVTAHW